MKLHFFEAWPHGYTDARLVGRSAKTRNGLVFFFLVRLVSAMGAPVLDLWSYGPTIAVSRYPITYWNSIFSGDRLKKHDPDHRSVPHVDMINASRQPVKQGGGMPVVTVMTSGGQQRDDIARGTTERGERGTWKSTSRGGWGDGIDGG
jgi:hypothetical protein